jgi:site-specific recombinase XerD
MTDDMVVRRMAEATQEAYLGAVVGLARFYHRSPDQITEAEVQAYLLHLIRERKRAWSTCNIVVHGLRFLYHVTLKRERTTFSIPAGRQPSTLPEILSREEIQRLIAATDSPKERALVTTAYATGLRVKELVHVKLTDLDAARGTIRVEQGKGAKAGAPSVLCDDVAEARGSARTLGRTEGRR